MKLIDKELLLKDICGRLPYQPLCKKVDTEDDFCECDVQLGYSLRDLVDDKIIIKPYLRPLSSMTEEETKELLQISNFNPDVDDICYDYICCIERTSIDIIDIANFISWLDAHHFDYRGLIEKGLAIEVTEENNPYK